MEPILILKRAITAVPAVKYAIGVAGVVSVVAIIAGFGIDYRVAVIGGTIVLLSMVMLVIFANIAGLPKTKFRLQALVFTWFALIMTMLLSSTLFGCVFFKWPLDLQYWIDPTIHNGAGSTSILPEANDIHFAEIPTKQTQYKDVFYSISDSQVLPYTFTGKADEINTASPADSGIAIHFSLQKLPPHPWLQVIDAEVEVHSFRHMPTVTKPRNAYAAGLQPYIMVVPLKPRKGTYTVSIVYEPLGLNALTFDRPTHNSVPVESMSSHPIEIREDSPQPLIVVATSETPGVYDITVKLTVLAGVHRESLQLQRRQEFAFATKEIVANAESLWETLIDEKKVRYEADLIRFGTDLREGNVAPAAPPMAPSE